MGLLQILRDNRAAALAERDQRDREIQNQAAKARLDEICAEISAAACGTLKTPGEMVDIYTAEAARKILADAVAAGQAKADPLLKASGLLPERNTAEQ